MNLKIGTRASKLALWQANAVSDMLAGLSPEIEVEIVEITTEGDVTRNETLADIGGKGLFVKDIERALLEGEVDIAVHSLKDVPTDLVEGLSLNAYPVREDPRDILISKKGDKLGDMPQGAVIGTGSLRRKAHLLRLRSDIEVKPIRGNVPTRIDKIEEGVCDGVILAAAGLKRLGMENQITQFLDKKEFIPAVGQGIMAVESRTENGEINDILDRIDNPEARSAAKAERSFLRVLEGDCHAPIAAYAQQEKNRIHIRGFVASPDAREIFREELETKKSPVEAGKELGEKLISQGAKELLESLDE